MAYTNIGLVKFADWMKDKNAPYWFGCYGQIASEALYREKYAQYKDQYSKWSKQSFVNQYGQKVADCSGLVKAYFMTPDVENHPENPAVYSSKYDLSADMVIAKATEKGDISTIPNIKGLIVWKKGHMGVYLGDGYVIEERGHSYGTVKTKLSDRPWEKWCKHPYIEYIEDTPVVPPSDDDNLPTIRKGSHGEEVKSLQVLLNYRNYRDQNGNRLEVDGSFGSKTEYAVKQLQRKYYPACGDVDGIVGNKTWKKVISP